MSIRDLIMVGGDHNPGTTDRKTSLNRFSHIDLIETIAILFVITYHSPIYNFDITQNESITYYLRYYGRTILSTCVPLFFFANGYLLFNKTFEIRKHVKKTLRIIILLLFWAIVLTPALLLLKGETVDINRLTNSILNVNDKWSLYWFMGALINFYIIFPALKYLFDYNYQAFKLFVVVCAFFTFGLVLLNQVIAIVSEFCQYESNFTNSFFIKTINPFSGYTQYSYVYFSLGGLIKKYEDRILSILNKKRNIVAIIAIFFSCTMLFLIGVFFSKVKNNKMWDVVWNGYDSIFTIINVCFIYILCLNYKGHNRLITSVSINSLGIYLTHQYIIYILTPIVKSVSFLCNYPTNFIHAYIIMIICLIICLIVKKIPILKEIIS